MSEYFSVRSGNGSAISLAPTMMMSTPCSAKFDNSVAAFAASILSTTIGVSKPFASDNSIAASTTAW